MEPAEESSRAVDRDLADALPAALERASLLEWRLEQVTLREKDLWLRLEAERTAAAEAQQRIADLTERVQHVEDALAEARRANAALTARLAEAEDRAAHSISPRAGRDAVALARAWRREHHRAEQNTLALREARDRLEVLEHAQVRFHTRLTEWQRQVATERQDLDLAEFIAELRAEVLRLGQANAALRSQLEEAPASLSTPPEPALSEATALPAPSVVQEGSTETSATQVPAPADEARRPAPPSRLDPQTSVPHDPHGPHDPRLAPAIEGLWSADPAVRRRSAASLSQNNCDEARRALATALPLAEGLEEQIHLLSQLGRAGGLDDEDAILPYLQHDNPTVRATALNTTSAVALVEQCAADSDPYVRRRALIRWAQLAPDSARSGLTKAIHDADPGVRRAACAALAGHEPTSAIMALLYAVDDPDPAVRHAAVRSLPSDIRGRLTPTVLADPGLRRAALNAIRMQRRVRVSQESSTHGR